MKETISSEIRDLLCFWLERQLPRDAYSWLVEKMTALRANRSNYELGVFISLTARKIGKDDLNLNSTDFEHARHVRPGWLPIGWSVDQAARIALLLSPNGREKEFLQQLCQVFVGADVGELITLYRGLPLYPGQEACVAHAIEGVRNNMKPVFESVAHHNPYPMERFDERAWNQMVLKALFFGSTLHVIQGLDERGNVNLMRMLCDFAHEQWAAGRMVSPELWRCVGGYADPSALSDLCRVIKSHSLLEREAAALALSMCPGEEAKKILRADPALKAGIDSGSVSWETIFRKLESD